LTVKRLLGTLAVPLILLGVLSAVSAPLAGAALPPGCHRSDKFGPGIKSMQHFFHCATGRYLRVVKHRDPNPVVAETGPDTERPMVGGPSCEWARHYFAKWCYSRGVPQLICDQFFYNKSLELHGHHCANPYYDDGQSFKNLWKHVVNVTKNHFLRRCTLGAVGGAGTPIITGVIVKGAESTGPAGIAIGAGVGCVSGGLSYWWH
jgi:hypothetical protein